MAEKRLIEILEKLRKMMPVLRAQYDIKSLWVFGSHANGTATKESDLDLLVDFDRRDFSLLGFIGLEQTLSDQLGLRVDLVDIAALRPEMKPFVEPQAVPV